MLKENPYMTMPGTSADAQANKALVKQALHELFVLRDVSALERYWDKNYVQHSPLVRNGREELARLMKDVPPAFHYEQGTIIGEGDLVVVHGRYSGFWPQPMIAIDIFRVTNGRIAEHWDVLQEEVPASATPSGNPMFTPAST
ncbi:MAG TPA: nuclear transport factor 2 family protein [Burkholderiaceae bacterium]|nr:nuclear transport factor 2 family protein [Burkholderiaceae bacterium]